MSIHLSGADIVQRSLVGTHDQTGSIKRCLQRKPTRITLGGCEAGAVDLDVTDEMIKIHLERVGETSVLEINVELDKAKAKPQPIGMRTGMIVKGA